MAALLHEKAVIMPFKKAIVFPCDRDNFQRVSYTWFTFKQLDEEIDRFARGLLKIGIKRGTRTVLMLKPSLEFFAVTFALFKIGAVVVFVDPGIGIPNLGKCLAEAQPEAFIGITKAHIARVLFRWASETIKISVTLGPKLFWGGHKLEKLRIENAEPVPVELFPPDEMGAIFFTSGSTGVSKGAVYTHGILTSQVRFIQETYNFTHDDIDVATFPLFALFDVCLGMTCVVPDMDATKPAQADPVKLMEAIENNAATVMFGSPALVNTLSRWGSKTGRKIVSVKKVISCGAPARNDVLERFHQMLPNDAEIFTPYGATEALPVSSIGSREILGETRKITSIGGGTCVGLPNEHVTVKIIKITDDPIENWTESLILKTGEIGEIAVKGPIVTREYYKRPEATKLAKITDMDKTSIWHRMGDLGRFDEKGRLWFCGRKAHRVTTLKGALFTIPCEAIFNEHPKVFRTALVGVGNPGEQNPVICVELESKNNSIDFSKIKAELLELGAKFEHTKDIKTFLLHDAFPVDIRHNAKIGREKLAIWATEQLKKTNN
ncbi:MAG: AMP-binding protein [Candidatus Riflebacteria bacterium]|nr:AMP-binding protein [Candidatus Riflebacteria bacterium]